MVRSKVLTHTPTYPLVQFLKSSFPPLIYVMQGLISPTWIAQNSVCLWKLMNMAG